jgi:histone H3/H4
MTKKEQLVIDYLKEKGECYTVNKVQMSKDLGISRQHLIRILKNVTPENPIGWTGIIEEIEDSVNEIKVSIVDIEDSINEINKPKTGVYKTYIMKDTFHDANIYKIGKAYDPKKRLHEGIIFNPFLIMLYVIDFDCEKELHEIFQNKWMKGEFFRLDDNDLKFIYENYNITHQKAK